MANGSFLGTYTQFAVAVDSVYCSTVGKRMLERGGSAVDAIIGSALCNSILNIQSAGIGGGHLMNIYIKFVFHSFLKSVPFLIVKIIHFCACFVTREFLTHALN